MYKDNTAFCWSLGWSLDTGFTVHVYHGMELLQIQKIDMFSIDTNNKDFFLLTKCILLGRVGTDMWNV